ncbi:YcxB family protein [Flavobacterium sp. N2038]|uniref:YcxB family protein n=1 Tax=Flavobacterium sp. N2038 TaxID=2986829 RepID=UPI0022246EA5|nr:YcxB family protein [Flavobacterium sp. N2038]
MINSKFSLEFKLSPVEIRKLNKMYFKNLYEDKVRIFSFVLLLVSFIISLNYNTDFVTWIIRNLIFVVLFLVFQYSFVNAICRLIFKLIKKLAKFDKYINKYKLNFTNSFIYVHSPLGDVKHKWNQIENAILTKDFFFLYIKEKNNYIISISNEQNSGRNIDKLIAFVEGNVTPVIKV